MRLSCGACCVFRDVSLGCSPGTLNGVASGVLKIVLWCRLNHSSVSHDTISLAQKDHPRLRGHLTPRDAQTVTLPSTSALSLWKISPVPGMRSEFPLCANWCNPSLRTVVTAEIYEGGSSSWSFVSFFRCVGKQIVDSVTLNWTRPLSLQPQNKPYQGHMKKELSPFGTEWADGCDAELSCKPNPALLSLATASPIPQRLMSQVVISVIFVALSHIHPI